MLVDRVVIVVVLLNITVEYIDAIPVFDSGMITESAVYDNATAAANDSNTSSSNLDGVGRPSSMSSMRERLQRKRARLRRLRADVRELREALLIGDGHIGSGHVDSESQSTTTASSLDEMIAAALETKSNKKGSVGGATKRANSFQRKILKRLKELTSRINSLENGHQQSLDDSRGNEQRRTSQAKRKHNNKKSREKKRRLKAKRRRKKMKQLTKAKEEHKEKMWRAVVGGGHPGNNGSRCYINSDCKPGLCCHRMNDSDSVEITAVCHIHRLNETDACIDSCQCNNGLHCFLKLNDDDIGLEKARSDAGIDEGQCKLAAAGDAKIGAYLNAKDSLFHHSTSSIA